MSHFRRAGFMLGVVGLAAAALWGVAHAQGVTKATDASFVRDDSWPQLPPGIKLTTVTSMLANDDGTLWVLHRSEPPIMLLDSTGTIIKSFGDKMFVQAHGLCKDRQGNIWAGDAGAFNADRDKGMAGRGSQFFKFSPDGKLLMTLGKAGVSKSGPDTFVGPTSCVVAPNGDIIISDGHIPRPTHVDSGDRLIRFSSDGTYIRDYGNTGSARGEFRGPHQLAYDSQGRLFVADRQNSRFQVFDRNMNVVAIWTQFGRPSGFSILKDDTLVTIDSESGRVLTWADFPDTDLKAPRNPGYTTGVRIGSAKTGVVSLHFDSPVSEAVAADPMGNLYIGGPGYKFLRKQ